MARTSTNSVGRVNGRRSVEVRAPEAGPSTTGSAREVFVSPRVVDQGAFNDFAQMLRQLIEQAGEQAEGLRAAAKEAETARAGLREALASGQARAESLTRTLGMIDQRTTEAERAMSAAKDAAATLDQVRRETEAAGAAQRTALAEYVEGAVRSFEGRVRSLEETLAGAFEQRVAAIVHHGVQSAQGATETLDHAAAGAVSRLTEATRTAERFVNEAADEGGRRLRGQADESVERLLLLRDGAIGRMEALANAGGTERTPRTPHTPHTPQPAPRLPSDDAHVAERLGAERKAAAETLERLEELLGEAEAVIGAAELAGDGEDPVLVPGSLGDLLARVKRAEGRAVAAATETVRVSGEAEERRRALTEEIASATARADQLTGALDARLMAAADARAAGRDGGEGLDRACAKAEQVRAATERNLSELARLAADLTRVLAELRPYRPLLTMRATAEVPGFLQGTR
ncbi:MAG: hypothetical protein ACT4PL_03155 [Phycisphaerales bacterium]